jgi:hypothetical protein
MIFCIVNNYLGHNFSVTSIASGEGITESPRAVQRPYAPTSLTLKTRHVADYSKSPGFRRLKQQNGEWTVLVVVCHRLHRTVDVRLW